MKKNNDFDFIQNKINTSLNAPESVNEDFVLETLEDSENKQKSNILPLKKKLHFKPLPAIAAAVAVVLIAAVGFGVLPRLQKSPVTADSSGEIQSAPLTAYEDYKQIKKDMKSIEDTNAFSKPYFTLGNSKTADASVNEESDLASPAGAGSSYGETFTQVQGVDEDDLIKTNGKYIFYAGYDFDNPSRQGVVASDESYYWGDYEQSYIFVFSAAGKNAKLLNKIKISDSAQYDEINGMYLSGNTLVVLKTEIQKTTVKLFDISDIEHIKKTGEVSQSGYFSASRLIGDKLFVVSNQPAYDEIPYVICGDEKKDIPATDIYKTQNPTSADFLVVSRIDIHSGNKTEQVKAVFGGSSNIYCNEEHMFVLADISRYNEKTYRYTQKSQLFKIDISDGIELTAAVTLGGSPENQYAMDEYNGVFRIAVTDSDKDGNDINRLYTFDENLNKLGALADFARGEHIEAVKFLGETAYVITYETTDPLFVIDLSDAASPALLGKVKIDGFSNTLIPIDATTILGIGTDDNWSEETGESLKLVVFDVTDRQHPKVKDEMVCNNTSSEAMYQTKQILRNAQNDTFTVYASFLENITKTYDSENDDYYYDYKELYGTLTFRVTNKHIEITNKYLSDKLISGDGRCTYVDNTIYMIDANQNIDCTNY